MRALSCLLVVWILFAGTGCGGGGGGSRGGVETLNSPSPAMSVLPPVSPEPCVETSDQGCVSESEYEALAAEVAGEYEETPSFQNQWGLEVIGADRAYANLALRLGPDAKPGDGVTVGVLDTGIDSASAAFRNKAVFERIFPDATDEDGSKFSHGTAVASVIAGEESPSFETDASGVAWGADLAVFAIPLGRGNETYTPIPVERLQSNGEFFADIIGKILEWRDGSRRIDFLNLSLGVDGIIENYSQEILREPYRSMVAVMAQENSEEKLVFVWAAGNRNGDECAPELPECVDDKVQASSVNLLAGLATRFPELQPHTVAVVAINEDGGITGFSNRCGTAADYCLAAPGEDIVASYFGPHRGVDGVRGTIRASGTSFAAPMVTGGLALMKQFFRDQLPNTDLVARILETADRSGVYADSAVYGQGLMDLGAATSPVGEPVVVAGLHVDGSGAMLRETGLQLGAAFGNGLVSSLGNREIAAFDTLGAPFWYQFGGLSTEAGGPRLSERLREFQQVSVATPGSPAGAVRIPLLEFPAEADGAPPALHLTKSGASAAASASHFALLERSLTATVPVAAGLTASALTTEGMAGQEPASGAALAWRPPDSVLGVRAGWLGERRSLLGTVSKGAFGSLRGSAAFAGVQADLDLGGWRVSGNAEIGVIRARAQGGVFESISPLSTSAFALQATRPVANGGAFRVSLSQPLRVEDGRARFAFPSGRTKAGRVVRDRVTVDVEPGSRQSDWALYWWQPTDLGEFRLGTTLSSEPGHGNGADAEVILLSSWSASF